MSALRGWMTACASSALLALGACGPGASYRTEHPGEAVPETCAGPEDLDACRQRLDQYASRLETLIERLGVPAGQSTGGVAAEAEPSPALSEESAPLGYGPGQPMTSEPVPNCSDARELRDRICELADAICELAARPEAAAETKATCTSSRESCERSRRRVAASCPN